jgi:hypothetical protein
MSSAPPETGATDGPHLNSDDEDYEATIAPDETFAPEGKKELGTWDIFSLIVNKMIGTGIFTAPAQAFLLTGSKKIAILMWVIGYFYSILRCVQQVVLSWKRLLIREACGYTWTTHLHCPLQAGSLST